jgi:UDP-N-acetylglucosamine acyltransferase
MAAAIHPQAIVAPGAQLGDGVEIGPFCVIGPKVTLGDGVRLLSHVTISGNTSVGARTILHPFTALGEPPQDLKFKGEDTRLRVGADNIIREHVTFHLGTAQGRGETVIGDRNFFMAGAHVGHDCIVGNGIVFANNAILGGRVVVDDFVILGGHSAVHQLGRVGPYAFIGGGAPVTGDVIPYGMVDNHGFLHGLNLVGLKRRGFKRETINALRAAYRLLFEGDGHFGDRVDLAAGRFATTPEVQKIIEFIRVDQQRPLCTPRRA